MLKRKFAVLIATSLTVLKTNRLVMPALASTVALACGVAVSAQENVSKIGLAFEDSGLLNRARIVYVDFVGECPGGGGGETKAWFQSSNTPPGPGRRVLVWNVTTGQSMDPAPYTDREYDEGGQSEGITISQGSKHQNKALAVRPGENVFKYEILERKQPIETGTFTAVFELSTIQETRNARWKTQLFCMSDPGAPLKECQIPGQRDVGTCPGNYEPTLERNVRALQQQQPVIIYH